MSSSTDEVPPPPAPIWTVHLPESLEIVWPPSYAESQRFSRFGGDCASRQNCHRSRRGNNMPAALAHNVLRLSSSSLQAPSAGVLQQNNRARIDDFAAAFPADNQMVVGSSAVPMPIVLGGTEAIPGETHLVNPWAGRVRDVFLSLLTRVLLIFLLIVFTRILIAQLSPNEE
uniref:Uncharacterized protein n=1 Tax=Globodera rostochiensis TaxID=31243 RepID=A0A914H6L6_GLORO